MVVAKRLAAKSVTNVIDELAPFEGERTERVLRYFLARHGAEFLHPLKQWVRVQNELDEISRTELIAIATFSDGEVR